MRGLLIMGACVLAMPAMAQEELPFTEGDHRWQHRLVYVFAPSDTLGAFAATVQRFELQAPAIA